MKVFVQRVAGDADPATDADMSDQPGVAHAADASLVKLPKVGHLLDGEQSQPVIRGLSPSAGSRHAGRALPRRRVLAAAVAVGRGE